MGCSSNKAHSRPQAIVKILTYSSHTTRNLPTSALDEGRPEFFCMKIRIHDNQSPDWEEVNSRLSQMSGGILNTCQKVYKHCNRFHSSFSYLEHLVHGVCLGEFSLVKALELIFLNAKVNSFHLSLKKQKSFPFVESKAEEPETVKIWNEIASLADQLINKKELEAEVNQIKDFLTRCLFVNDENLQDKGFAVVGEYLKFFVETCETIEKLLKELKEFVADFKTHVKFVYKKIDRFQLTAGMNFMTIVHLTNAI